MTDLDAERRRADALAGNVTLDIPADLAAVGTGTGADATGDDGAAEAAASGRPRPRRPRRRREWRVGGTSVQHWNWVLVGWGILSLAAGLLVSAAAGTFIGGVAGRWIGAGAVWLSMLIPVVFAFRISVPRGLFRFRPVDLLFGLFLGILLRFVQGGLAEAATGNATWPSYFSADGSLGSQWMLNDLLLPVLVLPVLEEFFFHGFLLVALFTVFRRLTDSRIVAGFGALLATTGLFVLLHQLTGSLVPTWDGAVSIALVALAAGLLVLTTGRLWSAVLLHITFNGTYVLLALVGTVLGVGADPASTLS